MAAHSFVLDGARVFDGVTVVDGPVVVRDGWIESVGRAGSVHGLPVVAALGTVVPGLIDSHTHTPGDPDWARRHLRQALAAGVTTMICLGTDLDTAKLIKSEAGSDLSLPDLRSSGPCATAPGGHPTQWGDDDYPTVATPAQAQAFVYDRAGCGMDHVKIVLEDNIGRPCPTLSPELTRVLVRAAHDAGLIALAHVTTLHYAGQALDAGIDGFAHQFDDEPMTPELARTLAARAVFTIGTLTVRHVGEGASLLDYPALRDYMEPASVERLAQNVVEHVGAVTPRAENPRAARALEAMRLLREAGATVLAGTDAPGIGVDGASLHLELELLVRGGLSPQQALTAATASPAKVFGLHDRGRILPGRRADLLLVDGDPTSDILDSRSIRAVWRHGELLDRDGYRARLAATQGS